MKRQRNHNHTKSNIPIFVHVTYQVIFDVVINLAGEPIANKRWSDQPKQRIISSRIDVTEKLIAYLKNQKNKPKQSFKALSTFPKGN